MNKLEHTFTTWTCSRDGGSRGVQGGQGEIRKRPHYYSPPQIFRRSTIPVSRICLMDTILIQLLCLIENYTNSSEG